MTGLEMEKCEVPDFLTMPVYLTQVYDAFRGEIPHIKHPKLVSVEKKISESPKTASSLSSSFLSRLFFFKS